MEISLQTPIRSIPLPCIPPAATLASPINQLPPSSHIASTPPQSSSEPLNPSPANAPHAAPYYPPPGAYIPAPSSPPLSGSLSHRMIPATTSDPHRPSPTTPTSAH